MKALTVQQPWAWAIFNGKNVENRTQRWAYRGPLAIHAGKRFSERGGDSPRIHQAWYQHGPRLFTPDNPGSFVYGCIIGTVDLVDIHAATDCCRPWGDNGIQYIEPGDKPHRQVVHLVLENPRPLGEPIPCTGALGLWTPPVDIAARLQEVAR